MIKTTLNEVISDQLKKARTVYNQHGRETMQAVADSPDVLFPMTTISAMENGKSLTPQNLKRLSDHYGVSMDYLFGDEGAAPARKVKIKLKKKQSEEGTMSIYLTPADLEEIRRADAEMERGGKPVFRETRGRKPGELPPNNRAANPVRDWRYRMQYTQDRAADILGVTSNTVRNWERGKCRTPKWVTEFISKEE